MGKVSAALNKAIEGFLQFAPTVSGHLEDKDNPHEVNKAQAGLGNVDNAKQATKSEFDAHRSSAVLPHADGSVTAAKLANGSVTANKIGNNAVSTATIANKAVTGAKIADKTVISGNMADGSVTDNAMGEREIQDPAEQTGTVTDKFTSIINNIVTALRSIRAAFTGHENSITNPHSVTKAQVGLSGVDNIKQATKAEYDAHVVGTTDKHTADTVIYDGNISVKQAIDDIEAVSGGTFNHNALNNREVADQHPTGAITGLNGSLGIIFTGTTDNAASPAYEAELFANPADYPGLVNSEGRFILKPRHVYAFRATFVYALAADFDYDSLYGAAVWSYEGLVWRALSDTAIVDSELIYSAGNRADRLTVISAEGTDLTLKLKVAAPPPFENYSTKWMCKLEITELDFSEV